MNCDWTGFGGVPIGLAGREVRDITAYYDYTLPIGKRSIIIYAGDIDIAGDEEVGNIVSWDGSSWDDLNGGLNGPVYDVETDSTDWPQKLYVAGDFTMAGNTPVNNVAVWDGTSWSSIGTGLENGVDDQARTINYDFCGNIYVGGYFENAGTVPANKIAKWDGTSWNALGSGISGSSASYVNTIELGQFCPFTETVIYAGGRFNTAGGISANNIASYDGTSWSSLGTGTSFLVIDIEMRWGGGLFACGLFNQAGGTSANRIAQWDGSQWSSLGSGVLAGLILDMDNLRDGRLMVGGEFSEIGGVEANGVAIWNGSSWSSVGTGNENGTLGRSYAVYEAYDKPTNKYVGGDFGMCGTTSASNASYWDGNSWVAMMEGSGQGLNYQIEDFAHDSQGNLYVVGRLNNGGISSGDKILKWDGTAWSDLSDDVFNGDVHKIQIDASDNIYICGGFVDISGVAIYKLAMWNGSSWIGLNGGVSNGNVYDIVLDSNQDLYAVGSFATIGGTQARNVAKWNGTAWAGIGNGAEEGINGVGYVIDINAQNDIYIGGDFSQAGTVTTNNICYWDGMVWKALGSGTNNTVRAIELKGGELYAGGRFSTAGGLTVNHIGKWNGSSWSSLGAGAALNTGFGPTIYSLSLDQNDNLFAAGEFTTLDGVMCTKIGRWDGSEWHPVGDCEGEGLDDPTQMIFVTHIDENNELFIGGNFTRVNGHLSSRIASYDITQIPLAICEDITIALDNQGGASISLADINGGSQAFCGLSTMYIDQDMFSCSDVGNQTVTLTIEDLNCNATNCTSVVTVLDSFGFCCPSNLYVQASPIVSGIYTAADKVHSDKHVVANHNVNFEAGQSICLNPGFEVQTTALFEAVIVSCH